jgi:excisionase family DNA binding protein
MGIAAGLSAPVTAVSLHVPMGEAMPEKLAYSIEEVAEMTGLSRSLLYDEMNAGRLDYIKVGRRRAITRDQVDAFLNAAKQVAA